MAKTVEERIEELQKRQAQLKAKEKALKAKQSQADRKARTKRLIEVGAIVEKAIGLEIDSQARKDKLLEILTKERPGKQGSTYTYGNTFQQWIERAEEKADPDEFFSAPRF